LLLHLLHFCWPIIERDRVERYWSMVDFVLCGVMDGFRDGGVGWLLCDVWWIGIFFPFLLKGIVSAVPPSSITPPNEVGYDTINLGSQSNTCITYQTIFLQSSMRQPIKQLNQEFPTRRTEWTLK
jgi:hypothetical protein